MKPTLNLLQVQGVWKAESFSGKVLELDSKSTAKPSNFLEFAFWLLNFNFFISLFLFSNSILSVLKVTCSLFKSPKTHRLVILIVLGVDMYKYHTLGPKTLTYFVLSNWKFIFFMRVWDKAFSILLFLTY